MRTVWLVPLIGFVMCVPVHAATWTVGPADCSSGTINDTITSAADGDTINLTCTGTVNWTSTVNIPNTKGIKLIGPGTNPSPSSTAPANFTLTITSSAKTAIYVNLGVGKSVVEVSGFKFTNFSGNEFIFLAGQGRGASNTGAYRIHNNFFDNFSSATTIHVWCDMGECTGLSDHNTFKEGHTDNYTFRMRDVYRRPGNACYGLNSWDTTPFNYGDSRFHFIENNYFYNATTYQRHQVSGDLGGSRYVVRYNTFDIKKAGSTDIVEAHGSESQGAGTRGGEIYHNTFLGSSGSVGRNINMRGGHWLIYNNTFSTLGSSGSAINFTDYRASSIDSWQVQSEPDCTSQPNYVGSDTSNYPASNQIMNTYTWNNVYAGSNQCPRVSNETAVSTYIQHNRDFFCTTSRPADLASYSPFTYPHPLQSSRQTGEQDLVSPLPPTGLTVK